MKKISIVMIIGVILLSSCGKSGWNCKNRYCNAPEKVNPTEKAQTVSKINV